MRSFSKPSEEDRMNIHKNARLTPFGRERIVVQVLGGQTPEADLLREMIGFAAERRMELKVGAATGAG